MKIAVLAQFFLGDETAPVNGSLVQLYNLSKALSMKDVELHYICATKRQKNIEIEIIEGIHVHWIIMKEGIFEWKRLMPLYQNQLKNIQPDALYVRGRNVLQYVAGTYARKHDKIFVWGTNGDDSAESWKNVKRLKQAPKSLLKKAVLYPLKAWEDHYINRGMRLPDYIVNQNTIQKEQTSKLLKREGLVLNSYYLASSETDEVVKNQVLWMARWSKEKQPELYLEMVSKSEHSDIEFVMAGGYSDHDNALVDRANNLGIKVPGKIDYGNVNHYFAKSLLFVNTSYREGVSNTFIEAMLQGVPVLSLNSNPNNWLTEYNIGFCADGDLKRLIAQMNRLLKNKEELKQMADDAKSFAKHQFSNDTIIDDYLKLFNGDA
ncbi:MAG: glycosyltransferase family 4 protein [Algicola sp.]|nr:glycosyltransferase family 4 protein [Algicola sp.]